MPIRERIVGPGNMKVSGLPDGAGRVARERPPGRRSRRTGLGSGHLDLARKSILVAAGLLGDREPGLGLGAGPLLLDAEWLCIHRRLLGLPARPSRSIVRA